MSGSAMVQDTSKTETSLTITEQTTQTPHSSLLIKYSSLVLLTLQNAVVILAMRYTRSRPGDLYMASTAVIMSELLKFLVSLIMVFVQEGGLIKGGKYLYSNTILEPMDCLKISIPSLIYTLQNNCIFIALSNLDAATFQVTYQLKILVTTLFSVLMLGKKISKLQWLSLVILFVGVSIVQLAPTEVKVVNKDVKHVNQNPVVGLMAVIACCFMTGFASVYFEKILKRTSQSLWLRNVELGFVGVIFGAIAMEVKDGVKVSTVGFFYRYNKMVWFVVLLHSFGGLMVALVVKYADNILKGFATSTAIIISCVAGIFFFDFHMTVQFACGTILVLIALFMYSKYVPLSQAPKENKLVTVI